MASHLTAAVERTMAIEELILSAMTKRIKY
jgi:hypothetical protein